MVIEFSCFVWAMVVWDNVEIDIKSTIMHYFEHALENTDSTSVDTIRWDRLQVKVRLFSNPPYKVGLTW